MQNKRIRLNGAIILMSLGVALLYLGIWAATQRAITEMHGTRATSSLQASSRHEPVKNGSTPAAGGVMVLNRTVKVFSFSITQNGKRVYRQIGTAEKGQLVKTRPCEEGWAQIEYKPDPEKEPFYWRVGWMECDGQRRDDSAQ